MVNTLSFALLAVTFIGAIYYIFEAKEDRTTPRDSTTR
jgi:hypothetical protein